MKKIMTITNADNSYGPGSIIRVSVPEDRWWMLLWYSFIKQNSPMRLKKFKVTRVLTENQFEVESAKG